MSVFKFLEENNADVYAEVTDILLRILDNVIRAPNDPKYRTLKLDNKIVSKKLMPVIGAVECLFAFGFEEGDDALILPHSVPLSKLKAEREELFRCKTEHLKRIIAVPVPKQVVPSQTFFREIEEVSKRVLAYENEKLQELARREIPIDKLKCRRTNAVGENTEFENEFGLLFELMQWYKSEFFHWMDSPVCKSCDSSSTFRGYSHDTADLLKTDRVEVYDCDKCHARLIFPRYNDPAILLKTRTGRCGEWANCFTLLCRSLKYEARYVLDKTDHVWTEVYSKTLQRWIHCDPCENRIDKPLMYEKGWNKQLTYVIAFSCEEVQDVTWRYTTDFDRVRSRRSLCNEEHLVRFILGLSKELQASLPDERKKYLATRRIMECIEFLNPPSADGDYDGRTSGSLQWRLSRSECHLKPVNFVWTINEIEKALKRFRVRYCTASDSYHRVETDEKIKGWQNGVYEFESVFRKVEHDWKMCYLCRSEGSDKPGTIKWKFSFEKQNLRIDRVKINYQSEIFYNGAVRFIICNDETCIPLKSGGENFVDTDVFQGSNDITLTVTLSGGSGKDAWQHAQLFRQSLSADTFPFDITITLQDESK